MANQPVAAIPVRVLNWPDAGPGELQRATPGRRRPGSAARSAPRRPPASAIVVTTAVRHQAPIVTSDLGDLTRITDAIGMKIKFFTT
jgi:hypothetical protein